MADEIDRTQDRLELEEQIKRQYRNTDAPIKGTGFCLNCGEAIRKDMRWCDSHCRDDFEHRAK